ncbi:MAG TPA: NlpC/P60 family protein, partial [Chitinophagaceae bacterium]|nr:NlpC/P60 family protein [Chitinophagaceae bacterium]
MLKNLAYMTLLALGLSSCHTLKPLSFNQAAGAANKRSSSPEFIQHITVAPSNEKRTVQAGGGTAFRQQETYAVASATSGSTITESLSFLQFKYGILLDIAVERLTNLKLLETIDEWYGTRYRYGGSTRDGIDCSAFTCALMTAAFGSALPRTSREQYAASQRIEKADLQEGDLVFFNTSGGVSHVGVYLNNNKFVHASTSSGVMISDLNEDYYLRKYV